MTTTLCCAAASTPPGARLGSPRCAWAYREHDRPMPVMVKDAVAAEDAAYALIDLEADETEARLQAGDVDAIHPTLVYLEVDPFYFRSGYRKDRLLRLLFAHDLAGTARERVLAILLRSVDVGGAGAGRYGYRLARRYATNAFRRALRTRVHAADPAVARRAVLMLGRVRHPGLSRDDARLARQIIDGMKRPPADVPTCRRSGYRSDRRR